MFTGLCTVLWKKSCVKILLLAYFNLLFCQHYQIKIGSFIFFVFHNWEMTNLHPPPPLVLGLPGLLVTTVTVSLIGKCRFHPNPHQEKPHTHTHTHSPRLSNYLRNTELIFKHIKLYEDWSQKLLTHTYRHTHTQQKIEWWSLNRVIVLSAALLFYY